MKMKWIVKLFEIALILLIVIAGFGQSVLQLWNWLVPSIFGLRAIRFWEAVGLLSLSWILFGGLRGLGGSGRRWRGRRGRKWQRLTPEQRAQLSKGFGKGCGIPVTAPEAPSER